MIRLYIHNYSKQERNLLSDYLQGAYYNLCEYFHCDGKGCGTCPCQELCNDLKAASEFARKKPEKRDIR